jgi:hypothetical protein
MRRLFVFGSLFLCLTAAFGQTSNTIFGAGYTLPAPINAAPGQILNLFVQGIGAGLTGGVAAPGLPLPTVLAGISVQLQQIYTPQSMAVPILAVRPASTCASGISTGPSPCGRYTVVTVQIPYEMAPNCSVGCPSAVSLGNSVQLVVSENGVAGNAIELNPVLDAVHIANVCDIDTSASSACVPMPLITHADGSLISVFSPATPGEEVVVYALGLGATTPAAVTGQASPSPAVPTQAGFEMYFSYEANAGPSKGLPLGLTVCYRLPVCPQYTPVFSGLTPGYVGLYQVNYVIPQPAQRLPACGGGVASNLTLSVIGATSFDGAGICVANPAGS